MKTLKTAPSRGFALLEALIALIVAAFALVAIVRLQASITKGAGDAISRSEALSLAQARLEELRAQTVTRAGYDAMVTATTAQQCEDVQDAGGIDVTTNATLRRCWQTVDGPAPSSRAVTVLVSWTDANNQAQQVQVQSVIAFDDPMGQGISKLTPTPPPPGSNGPLGAAKKGNGEIRPLDGATANPDGSYTKRRADGTLELLDGSGKVVLYVDPVNGTEQSFTVIRGRVYFDSSINSGMPAPADVRVRLSSEGYCFESPSARSNLTSLPAATGGSNSYRYFDYGCYVGAGWYGNVGVSVSTDSQGNQATVCVGDPAFNNGVSDGTLVSPHSTGAATRTYRGFRDSGGTYLSTGVAGGTSYPNSGAPLPSDYTGYGQGQGVDDHFNHHFLLTRVGSGRTCKTQMEGGVFAKNAGKYYCIAPDNVTTSADVCPDIWPNFENEVAGGGALNYTLDVAIQGNGVVTSSAGGIDCGNACSASFAQGSQVVLTASPRGNQTFTGWSGGGCSGTGTCTVTMDASKTVTAIFGGTAAQSTLTVTKTGSGTGTVAGGDISCGSTCTATYSGATTVTLTATPDAGSTFVGWSGACSGTGTCTVSVSGNVTVAATFATTAQNCITTVNGSLKASNHDIFVLSPSGAGTCTKQQNTANYSCTLTAAQGTPVVLQSQNKTLNVSATCSALENVNF